MLLRDDPPQPVDVVLVERAASTLALNRLLTRDLEGLERQTHRSLLSALMAHSEPAADVLLRARALGVPLEGRRLLGIVVRPPGPASRSSVKTCGPVVPVKGTAGEPNRYLRPPVCR